MATIEDRPRVETRTKLLNAADLAAMPDELPSGTVHFELDNGRLLVMSPPENRHGAVQAKLVGELLDQGERRGLGIVRFEVGVVLWRGPDRVVGPDVMFITSRSLPLRESPEGYLETIPELVVEVRSKNDTLAYYERKTQDYLKAGVMLVWFADPQMETVTVSRRGVEPQVRCAGDTLTAEDIVPGFSLPIADLFRE